jgi:DNA modification methylase
MAADEKQEELILNSNTPKVECLGLYFANDDERRTYFLEKLKESLADPEFRKIEGFPIGSDEDILAISDPPYYTACPNPFLEEFIARYGKPYNSKDPESNNYHREPFAFDVSVGKTDSIFTAHSYHTKVPHRAIMRYILHYTKPGDVVLDAFSGSGMTGVAAQMCSQPNSELRYQIESEYQSNGLSMPEWGARRAVLNDLGIAASFISANYNLPFDVNAFEREAKRILKELESEYGWMYETKHNSGKAKGQINYTIWSQVFSCPECATEIVFLKEALEPETKRVKEVFLCHNCGAELSKNKLDRLYEVAYDPIVNKTIQTIKRQPVLINYTFRGSKFEKEPDATDLEIISRIEKLSIPQQVPTDEIPFMHMTHQRARMEAFGITHIHHFFLTRSAQSLGKLWAKVEEIEDHRLKNMLLYFVEQGVRGMSLLNRFKPIQFGKVGGSQVGLDLNGVYYIPSISTEVSPWYQFNGKLKRLINAFQSFKAQPHTIVETGTAAQTSLPGNSIDYIFTDPPFGENIYYADLNFLVETWHSVKTNSESEAIVDKAKKKDIQDYQFLMRECFKEYYRVLKPNRWMTVVFHNSQNAIWNAIQEAMLSAGFVIANVRTLDKQQSSYRQITSTAVKQDLVISVYKPNGGIEERFSVEKGTESGVWDFVRTHLQHLPVFVGKHGQVEVLAERMDYLLFDRMVAFHLQRGATIPLSAPEFYAGLEKQKGIITRDNMYFLEEQINEYDQKRMRAKEIVQLELLVTDESSAVQWLRQQLSRKPQTYQEIHPNFTKDLLWLKHEKNIELRQILDECFLCYKGEETIPKPVVAWLRQSAVYRERIYQINPNYENGQNLQTHDSSLIEAARDRYYIPDLSKQSDLEKFRERSLLREFEEYRQSTQRKLTSVRLEAIRAGFKKAWQERSESGYRTIVEVSRKLSDTIIQEDEKLLAFFDNALTRLGED